MAKRKTFINPTPVIKKHLERAVKTNWKTLFRDPRSEINKKWDLAYPMKILFYGILSGCKKLREVENQSELFGPRISDTTLHDIAVRIDPEPMREEIVRGVKNALRSHELPKEDFPIRLTAIDGKCISVSTKDVGHFSQRSECNNRIQYVNRALRAYHVSNPTKLCLGQREINGKKAEMSEFIPFLDSLVKDYCNTSLLEVISVDAGMISRENADYIDKKNLKYIMGLKSPQKVLLKTAKDLMGMSDKPDKITTEKQNGKIITRKFFRCLADDTTNHGWYHLVEFWRIEQTVKEIKTDKVTVDDRYFLSSIPANKLSNVQAMQAIRMHWHIENNGNWVIDTAWKEDDCPLANKALILISLMRMHAYNILSRLKNRRLRQAEARELSWGDLMKFVEHALIQLEFGIETYGEMKNVFVS